jgi:hypothetical protein
MVESLSGLPDQLNASQRSSRCRTFSPSIERKDGAREILFAGGERSYTRACHLNLVP